MTFPNEVYVVVGSTGEYSYYREWFVCAYTDRKDAERHAVLAEEAFLKLEMENPSVEIAAYHPIPVNPYDPHMQVQAYTGTDYRWVPIQLYDSFKEESSDIST